MKKYKKTYHYWSFGHQQFPKIKQWEWVWLYCKQQKKRSWCSMYKLYHKLEVCRTRMSWFRSQLWSRKDEQLFHKNAPYTTKHQIVYSIVGLDFLNSKGTFWLVQKQIKLLFTQNYTKRSVCWMKILKILQYDHF